MNKQPPHEDEIIHEEERLAAEQLRMLLAGAEPTLEQRAKLEAEAVASLRKAVRELTSDRESAVYNRLRARLDEQLPDAEKSAPERARVLPFRVRPTWIAGFALAAAALLAIFVDRSNTSSPDRAFVEAQVRFLHDGDTIQLGRATRRARAQLLHTGTLAAKIDDSEPEQFALLERSERKR